MWAELKDLLWMDFLMGVKNVLQPPLYFPIPV